MSVNPDRFVFVPLSQATTPTDGECLVDRWWVVHPDKGVAFYDYGDDRPAPQCNPSEHVSRKVHKSLGKYTPGSVVERVPMVFMSHAVRAQKAARVARKSKP